MSCSSGAILNPVKVRVFSPALFCSQGAVSRRLSSVSNSFVDSSHLSSSIRRVCLGLTWLRGSPDDIGLVATHQTSCHPTAGAGWNPQPGPLSDAVRTILGFPQRVPGVDTSFADMTFIFHGHEYG